MIFSPGLRTSSHSALILSGARGLRHLARQSQPGAPFIPYLEKLKTEQAKGLADASIENLITEAEDLLGRIAGKSPAEKA